MQPHSSPVRDVPLAAAGDPQRGDRRGGDGQPPDLDELWRDFSRRLNTLLPRRERRGPGGPRLDLSGSGGTWLLVLCVVVLLLGWLGSGFYRVDDGEVAVLSTLGRPAGLARAGLHWQLPKPLGRVRIVDVERLRSVDIGVGAEDPATGASPATMLTADSRLVHVRMALQYRVADAVAFSDAVVDPQAMLRQIGEAAARRVVATLSYAEVMGADRAALGARVLARIAPMVAAAHCGVTPVAVEVQPPRPPSAVRAAADLDAVRRDGERQQAQAGAYAAAALAAATAEGQRQLQDAQDYAARAVQRAEGDAARFETVLKQYHQNPAATRETMYLNMMQDVLSHAGRVVIATPGSVVQLPQLPGAHPGASAPGAAASAPADAASSPAAAASAAASQAAGADDSRRLSRDRSLR